MKRKLILVVNGPNLNMLGKRNPAIYGRATLKDLEQLMTARAKELGVLVDFYQSNHEGMIVDLIQAADKKYHALIINAGAYSHYSYAIRDALEVCDIPKYEVHISDIYSREEFRHNDILKDVCDCQIVGKGFPGYVEALELACKV